MLKRILLFVLFSPFLLYSQYVIKGNINQGENFSWVLLYKVKNGKQIYLDNANVENNAFEFTISESEKPGIFRLYYQIENQQFIEYIYNKENFSFSFNPIFPDKSLKFDGSEENIMYQKYSRIIRNNQNVLDSLQVAFFSSKDAAHDQKITQSYRSKLEEINTIQNQFEEQTRNKLVHDFIKSSKQFNAESPIKNPVDYLEGVKKHFFDAVNFKSQTLSNSTLINEKILDYVFYLNQSNDQDILNQMQKKSLETGLNKLDNSQLKKNIIENILDQYSQSQNGDMVNYVLDNFYAKLPYSMQDMAFKNHVLSEVKTSIGIKSPDVIWEENGISKSLYKSNDSNIYIIVFFSSGCPHCQEEMPEFHKFIQLTSNINVITIGLEDEANNWENMVEDYSGFTNILDLDKWDSQRVQDFGISAIPNYFILNKDKIIIAKPENLEELEAYFE